MPNGQAHLMVNLAQDEFRVYEGTRCERVNRQGGAVLAGPHAQAVVIDTKQQHWLAAVEFRPGGAGQFFSLPMTEACDQVVHLPHTLERRRKSVARKAAGGAHAQAKFSVFEEALPQHLKPNHDPAIAYASLRSRRECRLRKWRAGSVCCPRPWCAVLPVKWALHPSALPVSAGYRGFCARCAPDLKLTGVDWRRNTAMPIKRTSSMSFAN